MNKVIVIGGGAAGMFAAAAAAGAGAQVQLWEKNEKLGKKIYITGKGRCNLTNACQDVQDLFDAVVTNPRFLYSAFYAFDNQAMMQFARDNGLRIKVERGQRVFPESDKASSVTKMFSDILKKEHVQVRLNSPVDQVLIEDGAAAGIRSGPRIERADRVIVCTGGLSYPSTGSTGDGYRFAAAAGHKVTEPQPSLVPLTVEEDWCASLSGLSLKNVVFTLRQGKKTVYSDFGEMMFAHFGITGPLVLTASTRVHKLKNGFPLQAEIDLKPALDEKKLDERILRDFSENQGRQLHNALGRLLPSGLIPVVIAQAGADPYLPVRSVTKAMRRSLAAAMKGLRMTVTGTRGFSEAIITQGGVNVKEIAPGSMESRLVRGLYFAGEVLDVDAVTGGFNLQIAWSTGRAAGLAAAEG